MSETATVLLAAFGGGLAGALLQPIVSYATERMLHGVQIRKAREARLRRMVVGMIKRGRRTQAVSMGAMTRRRYNLPMMTLTEVSEMTTADWQELWEPTRIADERLRSDVIQYSGITAELTGLCWEACDPQRKIDEGNILRLDHEMNSLQCRIVDRMDGLNWPEPDDL